MGRSRAFLEVFSCAFSEDYRFPTLEIFAFLYTFGTFAFIQLAGAVAVGEAYVYHLVSALSGLPLFIFTVLILKNIAYGLGGDLERGVIQTMLSYPLKRRGLLTAKLLSALGVALLIFLGIQTSALLIWAPDVIIAHSVVVFLSYAALISPVLLLAGILLLLVILLKRGRMALIFGICLYFAMTIASGVVHFIADATGSDLPLKLYAVVSPDTALGRYYAPHTPLYLAERAWIPTFSEVLLYLGASYLLMGAVFVIAYAYFERRLGV